MIKHHPGDDLLLSYGAGALGESWSLAAATHMALCPVCRAAVAAAEEVGGVLLDDSGFETLSEDALDRLMARLDEPVPPAPAVTTPTDAVLPQPLRDYLGGDVDSIAWKSIGGRVHQHLIPTYDSGQARMLLIPPGCPVPEHGHRGREWTLVLTGSFTDHTGEFARGDMQDADENIVHQPLAGRGEDCVCLAITDAPLRFSGLLPRLLQPFIRI